MHDLISERMLNRKSTRPVSVFERAARSEIILENVQENWCFRESISNQKMQRLCCWKKTGHNMLVIYLFPLKCQQLTFSTLFTIFHQLFKIKWDFADFRLKIGKKLLNYKNHWYVRPPSYFLKCTYRIDLFGPFCNNFDFRTASVFSG